MNLSIQNIIIYKKAPWYMASDPHLPTVDQQVFCSFFIDL